MDGEGTDMRIDTIAVDFLERRAAFFAWYNTVLFVGSIGMHFYYDIIIVFSPYLTHHFFVYEKMEKLIFNFRLFPCSESAKPGDK